MIVVMRHLKLRFRQEATRERSALKTAQSKFVQGAFLALELDRKCVKFEARIASM